MSQMPDDYDNEDNEVVNCYTTKEFREAIEKNPFDTMIYLRGGEGQFSVPNVDRRPQHIAATDEAAMMVIRSREGHMLRCAIPADEAVIMSDDHSVKSPWADVIKEIEFDWRQVP